MEIDHVMERIEFAGKWASKYASERYRIKLQETIPATVKARLSTKQKAALSDFGRGLEKAKTENAVSNLAFSIAKSHGLKPNQFFSAAYLALLGKESGPRLATFIVAAGKEKVAKILKELDSN